MTIKGMEIYKDNGEIIIEQGGEDTYNRIAIPLVQLDFIMGLIWELGAVENEG